MTIHVIRVLFLSASMSHHDVLSSSDPAYHKTCFTQPALLQDAYIPQALRPNVRVTLQMGAQPTEMTLQQPSLGAGRQVLFGQLAKPSSPREIEGTYWGYTTRLASSISQVFKDGPYGVRSTRCIFNLYDVGGADSACQFAQFCAFV